MRVCERDDDDGGTRGGRERDSSSAEKKEGREERGILQISHWRNRIVSAVLCGSGVFLLKQKKNSIP